MLKMWKANAGWRTDDGQQTMAQADLKQSSRWAKNKQNKQN